MKILGLEIPEGQRLWFWSCAGETGTLLFAKDHDEAYSKAIASRIGGVTASPEVVRIEQGWFARNDTLEEVVGEYAGPPFAGELHDVE